MRSQSNSWTALLAKLGINLKRNYSRFTKSNARSRKLRFENCEDRRMLAVFTVTNPGDAVENTPAAIGTLRKAIFDAEQTDDHDTINFASNLDGATITLGKDAAGNSLN